MEEKARLFTKDLVQSRRGWGEGVGTDVKWLSRRKRGLERIVQGPQYPAIGCQEWAKENPGILVAERWGVFRGPSKDCLTPFIVHFGWILLD